MPRKLTWISFALAASALALVEGCSAPSDTPGCQELCATTQLCPMHAEVDCADVCSKEAALREASGCTAAFDASLRCTAGLTDICSVDENNKCAADAKAYAACTGMFCADNAAAPACPQR
jgi:hypothetical protein